MIIDCGKDQLIKILNQRLILLGFIETDEIADNYIIDETLERTSKCFSHSRNKRFSENGETKYSIMHSVQSTILLYYLSNTAYNYGNIKLADSIYYLNKIMHSVDWFYEIELPDVFGAEHPVGSVLGRAKYGNRLFIHQNTTIGSSVLKFPTIGDNVVLACNSCVLGDCKIGNNVIISAGTTVINKDVPDNSIVFCDGSIKRFEEKDIKKKISILSDFIE